ncbi:MAG: type II toxin-antitoxin system VapC family toxin [Kiritimatiellia bacterium]
MITAVDSSVLWLLTKREDGWEAWAHCLQSASAEGQLVLCPVVFAELAPSVARPAELLRLLDLLQIRYDEFRPESAFLAGQTFHAYRRAGGPREHLVPDFLIAAHALTQANRLAASDRGYLRRWFPKLRLLAPA